MFKFSFVCSSFKFNLMFVVKNHAVYVYLYIKVDDCKKRWKSLKDVYLKKHMDALAFLDRVAAC